MKLASPKDKTYLYFLLNRSLRSVNDCLLIDFFFKLRLWFSFLLSVDCHFSDLRAEQGCSVQDGLHLRPYGGRPQQSMLLRHRFMQQCHQVATFDLLVDVHGPGSRCSRLLAFRCLKHCCFANVMLTDASFVRHGAEWLSLHLRSANDGSLRLRTSYGTRQIVCSRVIEI
jgi:hypothetical protein